ncbi:membrane protein [Ferrigenium kumadai]|uniref:Membrane protein n=1 Tax=Ferrigenium kumadai TaxID=1682490 RepID=A0AAN1VZT4_9PROT|nr:DUF1614 domain-containing protein [Ferrigenium kumadai]BBI98552.1 membrane protein [Ferrigenium kumadai]
MPKFPLRYLLLIAALAMLVVSLQLGALTIAFEKLGLSPDSALLLFLTILGGSLINLPLFSMKSEPPKLEDLPPPLRDLYSQMPHTGRTIVLVNVGGCVVPAAFSIYLLTQHPLNIFYVILAVAAVALLCFKTTRALPGVGLGAPMLLAPLMAALVSIALDPADAAPLAFISGTLGVLIGADLLHLRDIQRLGAPFASIGGAGSFDGIFISGLVAVLLA